MQSWKDLTDGTITKDDGTAAVTDINSSTARISVSCLNQRGGGYDDEALRSRMEMQRKVHLQVEVEKHFQLRKDSERRYLDNMLERAYKMLPQSEKISQQEANAIGGGKQKDVSQVSTSNMSHPLTFSHNSVPPTHREVVKVDDDIHHVYKD